MTEAITPWLHIVAVTVWVGPQFFMFVAAVPALRAIDDPATRARVMRIIIYRFGWLAWGAMAVIVLTGISNLFQEAGEFAHVFDRDYRYVWVFTAKMGLLALTVLLTALHTFVVGPQQLRLHEELRGDTPEAARLRRTSIILSSLALLASLGVVFGGALLSTHEFSRHPV